MPGKQHVVACRQATEYVILDHVVGFIFKEQIAFVLIDVHTQRTNFSDFSALQLPPENQSMHRDWY